MKRLGITQRVENITAYGERRDCLDQRWYKLLLEFNYIPIPLPNIDQDSVSSLLNALSLDSIIFSGGNSIAVLDESVGDISFKRDKFETELLKEAITRNINVLGVCRGMQMINLQMGGSLSKVSNHVAVKHTLNSLENNYMFSSQVNSFHSWGIAKNNLAKKLKPLAIDSDGNIEAFENEDKSILGIMWHPEREEPFDKNDMQLIKRFL